MILMLHILIALATVGGALYTAISPTTRRTGMVYAGIGATVMSGVVLVFISPQVALHACASGAVTVAATLGMQYFAHRRMSASGSAE